MSSVSASYHTHSLYSDGKATIAEMVAAAKAKGFAEIGISDHLVLHPELERVDWAMPVESLPRYVADVRECVERERRQGRIRVRLGLEVDWFPDSTRAAELEALLRQYRFDYLIGSVHFVGRFSVDSYAEDWAKLSVPEIDQMHSRYWRAVADLARHNVGFAFVGHLDLPKKFNYAASPAVRPEVDNALRELARAGLPVEINTAGWDKPCAAAYPSLDLLQCCRDLGMAAILSDDAHAPDQLGRYFADGLALAERSGIELLRRLP